MTSFFLRINPRTGQHRWRKRRILGTTLLIVLLIGLLLPQRMMIPVQDATSADWHPKTFWFYPWGTSGTHKGMDIFAKEGTPVLAATGGWVVGNAHLSKGGNTVLILGPKWRFHYYAHLASSEAPLLAVVRRGQVIGRVGTTGNAKGKPPHLHYSMVSLIPMPWRIDQSPKVG